MVRRVYLLGLDEKCCVALVGQMEYKSEPGQNLRKP
jgi:hypothetical protein